MKKIKVMFNVTKVLDFIKQIPKTIALKRIKDVLVMFGYVVQDVAGHIEIYHEDIPNTRFDLYIVDKESVFLSHNFFNKKTISVSRTKIYNKNQKSLLYSILAHLEFHRKRLL